MIYKVAPGLSSIRYKVGKEPSAARVLQVLANLQFVLRQGLLSIRLFWPTLKIVRAINLYQSGGTVISAIDNVPVKYNKPSYLVDIKKIASIVDPGSS